MPRENALQLVADDCQQLRSFPIQVNPKHNFRVKEILTAPLIVTPVSGGAPLASIFVNNRASALDEESKSEWADETL